MPLLGLQSARLSEITQRLQVQVVRKSGSELEQEARGSMTEEKFLNVTRHENVATLTLDRSTSKNALSIALRNQISDALDVLADDDGISAVVLTGAGDTFSAGFDLKEYARVADPETGPEFSEEFWASSERYHRTVAEFPLPLVAAVNGPALAGGFDLALMCDIRIGSDNARFAHPEIRFTTILYEPLREIVGGAVARELALTGRAVEAAEALSMGIIARIVPAADLVDEAVKLATEIAIAPRAVLKQIKARIVSASTGSLITERE